MNLHWVNGERSGIYRVTNAFDVNPVVEPEGISPGVSDKAVNAGTFKGIVAIYAKGYQGSRLSVKVGEDWVIVDSLESNFERIIERTRWIDHGMQVRIFIDRVLMATIPLRSE